MADIGFKPGVLARKSGVKKVAVKKAVAKAPAAKKAVADRKHRGQHAGAVKVAGQTAAVAGISGALLLALKAMVLVAPSVLPHGNGLDSLGRPVTGAGIAGDNTAPVSIGTDLNNAPASGVADRVAPHKQIQVPVSKSNHDPVQQPPKTPSDPPKQSGPPPGNGNQTPPVAQQGPLKSVTNTVDQTVNSLIPGAGDTVGQVLTPVTQAADPVVKTVTDAAKPVLKPVTDTANQLPLVGPTLGGLISGISGS